MSRPQFGSIKSESQEENPSISMFETLQAIPMCSKVENHWLSCFALLYSVYSLVSFSTTIAGGMVSLKKQNEGCLKRTKALQHWILMVGSISFKNVNLRTKDSLQTKKHKNDALLK